MNSSIIYSDFIVKGKTILRLMIYVTLALYITQNVLVLWLRLQHFA